MNCLSASQNQPSADRSAARVLLAHRVCLALFLIQFLIVWLPLVARSSSLVEVRWPIGLLLVQATVTLIVSHSHHLPAQNVLLGAGLIAILGGGLECISLLSGFPLGKRQFGASAGFILGGLFPWSMPLLWIVTLLSSRGTAKLVLQRSRNKPDYGFRVIGLTALLTLLLELGLEPFAIRVCGQWLWRSSPEWLNWYGVPWFHFVGLAFAVTLVLALATPALISKAPTNPRADYTPLVVWIALNLLFAAGAATHQLWMAIVVSLLGGGITATLTLRRSPRLDR